MELGRFSCDEISLTSVFRTAFNPLVKLAVIFAAVVDPTSPVVGNGRSREGLENPKSSRWPENSNGASFDSASDCVSCPIRLKELKISRHGFCGPISSCSTKL